MEKELKEVIQKIIEKDDEAEMKELGELLVCSLEEIKRHDLRRYEEIADDIYVCANGKHLNESMARSWTARMQNADGSTGGKWDKTETDNAAKNVGIDFSKTKYTPWDWFAVMNMAYSDYYTPEREYKDYITIAKQFIEDKDACEGKTYLYYKYIVKKR